MQNLQQHHTLLNQWIDDYQALYQILVKEQQALAGNDYQQLAETIAEKNHRLNIINQHTAADLANSGLATNMSMDDFKSFCLTHSELAVPWKKLTGIAEKCQQKNEVNAELVGLLIQSSKRLHNLIKGFDPDNHLYNARGNQTKVSQQSAMLLV